MLVFYSDMYAIYKNQHGIVISHMGCNTMLVAKRAEEFYDILNILAEKVASDYLFEQSVNNLCLRYIKGGGIH